MTVGNSAGHSVWVPPGLVPIPEVKPHVVGVLVRCESSREAPMSAPISTISALPRFSTKLDSVKCLSPPSEGTCLLMPTLASIPLQFGGDVNSLLNIVWLLSFFVFIVYGQRIQIYIVANDISRALNRLKVMKDKSRKEAVDYFTGTGKTTADPSKRIDEFLEYVTIMPVDLDPSGLVGK